RGDRFSRGGWRSRPGAWLAIPSPVRVVSSGGRTVAVTIAGSHLLTLDPASGKPVGPERDLGFWPAKAPLFAALDGDARPPVSGGPLTPQDTGATRRSESSSG